MAKVLENDPMFKKGSYDGQRSDGLYMDGALVELMDIFARKIVNDMQFLGLFCSSTFGVRTGKSTLAQQIAYYYTAKMNELHGLNLTFDHRNIVFKTDKLIEKAGKLPKYSVLILDEGDDLTEHSASEKSREIKRFLRKSGQLNLFIMFILPDFFEMPKTIAMQRSNFLIDVKFEDEFDRGFFEYYNFRDKKRLYAKGKKFGDYDVQKATVPNGRFVNKYCVDEQKYRAMKLADLKEADEKDDGKIDRTTRRILLTEVAGKLCPPLKEKYGITQGEVASYLGIDRKTIVRYLTAYRQNEMQNVPKGLSLEVEDLHSKPNNSGLLEPDSNDTIIPSVSEGEKNEGGEGEKIDNMAAKVSIPNQPTTLSFNMKPREDDRFQSETKKEGTKTDYANGITKYEYGE